MAAPNDGSHGADVSHDPSWPLLASGNPSSPDGANLLPDAPQAGNHISIQAPLYSFYSQLFPSDLRRLRSAIEAKYLGRLCSLLQPRNVASQLGDIDKQFAVVWLDSETVVWGTKCNKLLVHNLRTGHLRGIPLVPVPEGVRRPKEKHNEYGKCGIHSVAINPSRTLLASGGDNPNDIMIYRLPDFKPVKTFLGHQDWVFGLNWITDEHLASGGRDGRMNLWTVSPREGLYHGVRCTRTNLLAKKSKVRESSYCWRTRELVALDPEGFIRQMDTVTWQVAAEWRVGYDDEDLICMNSQEHLVAAGGEQDLLLLDTRTRGPVLSGLALPHCDEEGLRSVRINRNIVSCGGSYGTLSFYDLAAGKWVEDSRAQPAQIAMLHVGPASCVNPTEEQRDIQQQLMLADRDYMNECAVYCQDWDPSGKVLITGGGPLAIGLRGCYGAIWT